MKNVKKSGLTLIETVLSILIIGISAITILNLQTILSRGVFSSHNSIERISLIKNMFIQADKEKLYNNEKPFEKKIDDPSIVLTYKIKKFPELKTVKNHENIIIEQVEGSWRDIFGSRQENIITFRFNPKVKK